jgi:alpha-tubulin suppressor-like RCC1 family protein
MRSGNSGTGSRELPTRSRSIWPLTAEGPAGRCLRLWTVAAKVLACVAPLGLASWAEAQAGVKGWGGQVFDTAWSEGPVAEIAAGYQHTAARQSDGSVVVWGNNNNKQCNVPALPAGLAYREVAAGWYHTAARRSDGSAVAWGFNGDGQCNVPSLPPGLSYVELSAGGFHTVARRSDGSVRAWGKNDSGPVQRASAAAGAFLRRGIGGLHVHHRAPR